MAKLRAVLIGATGLAGQQFISALKDHPDIELTGRRPRRARRASPTWRRCAPPMG
ncbi:hypothetical protein ACN28S_32915 [Cystobacter fuscus]